MEDYLPFEDEAVYNVLVWLHEYKFIRRVLVFPFKIINRLFKLRNRLERKIGVYPQ